jgi:hypothetical protein
MATAETTASAMATTSAAPTTAGQGKVRRQRGN